MFSKIWRAVIVELLGQPWLSLECPSNSYISLEQTYTFRKLHPQEGMSYIWSVKSNLQAPPLTIPLPIKNLLTEHQKVNNLFVPVNPLSQAYIRSWLVYSKCQYRNEPKY